MALGVARLLSFARPAHDRKLIPDGRYSGAMPWVMAIMLFLTVLAAAAALAFTGATGRGSSDLAREATVRILSADPGQRVDDQQQIVRFLKQARSITDVTAVPAREARALLEPWLGETTEDSDIPVPALIDIRFSAPPTKAQLNQLRQQLKKLSPDVRVDTNAEWLQPFFDLMQTMQILSGAVVLLLLMATAATVALAVRGALNTHRSTIEIMHMMGATDLQAARLFQRRVALDALFGGVVGTVAAILVMALLGSRVTALEPALLAGSQFPLYGWPVIAAIPLLATGLAMAMARWTVLSVLKKML